MAQCEQCGLDNAKGALYCARCHAALPRPLAPGECSFCGFIPDAPGTLYAVCPSCENDPQKGREVRSRRIAALQAQAQTELQQSPRRSRAGCLPALIVIFICVLFRLWS